MLVDALLDMSRLESGTEIEFRSTNIRALLSDACERVQASIDEKQLQLVTDLENLTSQIKASAPELGCTFKKLLDVSRMAVENRREYGGPWLVLELLRKLELDQFLRRTVGCTIRPIIVSG